MTPLEFLALGAAITVAMAGVDFAHARYLRAFQAGDRYRAGGWSVVQWCATSVGLVVAVKVTFWLLPFEPLGLFIGSVLGTRRPVTGVASACQP